MFIGGPLSNSKEYLGPRFGEVVSEQTVRLDRDNALSTRFSMELPDVTDDKYQEIAKQISEYVKSRVSDPCVLPALKGPINQTEKGVSIPVATSTELGVYRPDVNDRKVGKVRVELVDNGFPLALREIAKVMTWAQEAKGYKDHDWQNLPNAEIALAAAASRHRTDFIMQRYVDELPATACVDHESSISHKAHEAFGVLAQLELLLRGEFDK